MKNQKAVLLDTSFFLRLLNPQDPLHNSAKEYFRYFLEHDIILKISTIAVAEFCVKGDITDLPLQNLQILPFNFDHAQQAGNFMRVVYNNRQSNGMEDVKRLIIPNDTKMFAQADKEESIMHYISSDRSAIKIYETIKKELSLSFEYVDISTPVSEFVGELSFN